MAAEDGLKAQKLLAQGVLDVTYDTPSFFRAFLFAFFLAFFLCVLKLYFL